MMPPQSAMPLATVRGGSAPSLQQMLQSYPFDPYWQNGFVPPPYFDEQHHDPYYGAPPPPPPSAFMATPPAPAPHHYPGGAPLPQYYYSPNAGTRRILKTSQDPSREGAKGAKQHPANVPDREGCNETEIV